MRTSLSAAAAVLARSGSRVIVNTNGPTWLWILNEEQNSVGYEYAALHHHGILDV